MMCQLAPAVSDEAPLVCCPHMCRSCGHFDYDAQRDNELTLRVGQVLKKVCVLRGSWAEGELFGEVGMFPTNFVEMRKVLSRDRRPPPPVAKEGQ